MTMAFDLAIRDGFFKILSFTDAHQSCFHDGMKAGIHFDSCMFKEFDVNKGIKQGCILDPTLLWIFFTVLFKHAFALLDEGIYLCSRTDSKLFHISRFKASVKTGVLIREHFL